MKLIKTIYNDRLLQPDSYTVECGKEKAHFPAGSEKKVGEWILNTWRNTESAAPAYIYYNIGWDCDHVLYCKYEREADDFFSEAWNG